MADWKNIELTGADEAAIVAIVTAHYAKEYGETMPAAFAWTLTKSRKHTNGKLVIGFPPMRAPRRAETGSTGAAGAVNGLSAGGKRLLGEAIKIGSHKDRLAYLNRALAADVLVAADIPLIQAAAFAQHEAAGAMKAAADKAAAFLRAEAAPAAADWTKGKAGKALAKA